MSQEADFRWRSTEIMRIEGLSDGVFAFVVTLLVVSLEVPTSYAELTKAMLGFPAFGACFLLLLMIWWAQHIWFRRYGLQDTRAVVLKIFGIFVLLYRHAWSKRAELALDENESFATQGYVQFYLVFVAVGLLSLAISAFGGDRMLAVAGFSYGLLGPGLGIHGYLRGKKRQAQLASAT